MHYQFGVGGASEVHALSSLSFEHIDLQSQGSRDTIAGLLSTICRETWVLSSAVPVLLCLCLCLLESTDTFHHFDRIYV